MEKIIMLANSTYSDDISRDPLDTFTDREQILNRFKQLLHTAQRKHLSILAVKGNSGAGKTSLIHYMRVRLCIPFHWQTVSLSFAERLPDFRLLLSRLEDALKEWVQPKEIAQYSLKKRDYEQQYNEYIHLFLNRPFTIYQSLIASESTVNNVSQNVHI